MNVNGTGRRRQPISQNRISSIRAFSRVPPEMSRPELAKVGPDHLAACHAHPVA